jgi:sec-independent protein translocase protein TatB
MFEVGFTEIVLILGIALLVLGPARLPKLAADIGRWAGKARGMARQLRNQLEQEASTFDDLRNPLKDTPRSSQTTHKAAVTSAAAVATTMPEAGHTATAPPDPEPISAAAPPAASADTLDATDESTPG